MKKLVFIISFFSYSGYYAGLAILFSLGLGGMSRFYSIPLRLFLLFAMIYLIKNNIDNIKFNKYSKIIPLFIIFWCYYFIKILYTENIDLDFTLGRTWPEYIFYSLSFVIFPFITFTFLSLDKFRKAIVNGFIISGFVLGVIGVYLYGSLLTSGIGRINLITYQTGEAVLNPLSLSYSGALTIVLCIYKLVIVGNLKKAEKIFLIITIGLSFALFLLGSSRGSIVALAFTLPLFIAHSPSATKLKLILISVILTPFIIWAITASGSNIFDRVSNTSKDGGGGRDYLWTNALSHFLESPIFGGRIEIGGIYPHNLIIEILMATGIIGSLIILPIIFKGFIIGFRRVKENKENMFLVLILIQGFTQHFFSGSFATATLVFLPLGMAYSSYSNQ
ncbi:O-antigen ligase family protein [Arenibacter latericius]|uniref:O-antigen ligase family protein n=1 Tax=Arenibacter latericius TaxID=86104 RepID=UPI00040302B3|nr:O-antigen ligase family protein [Arenibacter latericius]